MRARKDSSLESHAEERVLFLQGAMCWDDFCTGTQHEKTSPVNFEGLRPRESSRFQRGDAVEAERSEDVVRRASPGLGADPAEGAAAAGRVAGAARFVGGRRALRPLFVGACCQGMLGLNNFLIQLMGIPIRPPKVNFWQGSKICGAPVPKRFDPQPSGTHQTKNKRAEPALERRQLSSRQLNSPRPQNSVAF